MNDSTNTVQTQYKLDSTNKAVVFPFKSGNGYCIVIRKKCARTIKKQANNSSSNTRFKTNKIFYERILL